MFLVFRVPTPDGCFTCFILVSVAGTACGLCWVQAVWGCALSAKTVASPAGWFKVLFMLFTFIGSYVCFDISLGPTESNFKGTQYPIVCLMHTIGVASLSPTSDRESVALRE